MTCCFSNICCSWLFSSFWTACLLRLLLQQFADDLRHRRRLKHCFPLPGQNKVCTFHLLAFFFRSDQHHCLWQICAFFCPEAYNFRCTHFSYKCELFAFSLRRFSFDVFKFVFLSNTCRCLIFSLRLEKIPNGVHVSSFIITSINLAFGSSGKITFKMTLIFKLEFNIHNHHSKLYISLFHFILIINHNFPDRIGKSYYIRFKT